MSQHTPWISRKTIPLTIAFVRKERGAIIQHFGGLYLALLDFEECDSRGHAVHMEYAHEGRELFPIQYPSVVGILRQWVRALYGNGIGALPVYVAYPAIYLRLHPRP